MQRQVRQHDAKAVGELPDGRLPLEVREQSRVEQRQRRPGAELAVGHARTVGVVVQAQPHRPHPRFAQAAPGGPPMRDDHAMSRTALAAASCALALAAAGCGSAHAGRPLAVGQPSRLPASSASHIVIVVMENAEYGEVIGSKSAPYVNALARRYGLATQSYAVAHPSLPNYLALTSGSTQGIESDCSACVVRAPNIVDQLEARGISWKAYLEDAPRPCYLGAGWSSYARKHNPLSYYEDVVSRPARCRRLVGFATLASDLRTGSLPTYAWVTPNLCDDGHELLAARRRHVPRPHRAGARSRARPARLPGPTWDEGTSDEGCCGEAHGGHIATIVAGPQVIAGARDARAVDHYGVLGTIERALGLPLLGGAADPRAGTLDGLSPRPRRCAEHAPGSTVR